MIIEGKQKPKIRDMRKAKDIAKFIADDFNANYSGEDLISYLDVLDMFGMLNLGFVVDNEETGEPALVLSSHTVSHAYFYSLRQRVKS